MEENSDIIYKVWEKEGHVIAIWEMKDRKHLRTIDPRSEEGRHLLGAHDETAEHHEADAQAEAAQ